MGYFKKWLEKEKGLESDRLPLTHTTKGFSARKAIDEDRLKPIDCKVFGKPLIYTFYGRPAYKVSGDGAIKLEGMCPICFVLDADLLARSSHVHPFDTGAYESRLYKHVFSEEIGLSDFEISNDPELPNVLIEKFFNNPADYFDGNTRAIPEIDSLAPTSEMEVRAYHELITSAGRNEPDDRIYSIEVTFSDPIPISKSVEAVIVPHTLWLDGSKPEWLLRLQDDGIQVCTYEFNPGRAPEHYHAHLEVELRRILAARSLL